MQHHLSESISPLVTSVCHEALFLDSMSMIDGYVLDAAPPLPPRPPPPQAVVGFSEEAYCQTCHFKEGRKCFI